MRTHKTMSGMEILKKAQNAYNKATRKVQKVGAGIAVRMRERGVKAQAKFEKAYKAGVRY